MTINVDMSGLLRKFKDAKAVKREVMKPATAFFIKQTPVKTGNARANTGLVGDKIVADYPYAFVLDAGRSFRDGQMRGSTQAPKGMTEPTMTELARLINQYIKRIGSK